MTQPWWHYWWDAIVLAQVQAFFSVVGACLAILAVWYAWRVAQKQFRLADEQGKIIDQQVKLQDRQLAILEEHKAIFLRLEESEKKQEKFLETQAGIVETQHKIAQAQMARRAELSLAADEVVNEKPLMFPLKETSYQVSLINRGTKGCNQVLWTLMVPSRRAREVAIEGAELAGLRRIDGLEYNEYVDGRLTAALPGRPLLLCKIAVARVHDGAEPIDVLYFLACEDGRFPADDSSYARLTLEQTAYEQWELPRP